ncbi:Rieske (2Fe-2S) protein [Picrophilus oshimae]|uniref:Rieske iron-sulfur protein n=1 Tax=Picrophilus torridus (strain ATCC 700027 / DSM 9790 / JCM 10055 / NBRC 100828 / KAW 2/3) TaxID=1122961 RepID=Q6L1Q6_PICTO|nr:Rieske (2Fe-2S) protein [Picrophilus oshimae]AAT43096.1 Rieske iron-sulfur protein [Picrophilus oshimae DSM 9789]
MIYDLIDLNDLEDGKLKKVSLNDIEVLLYRDGSSVYAYEPYCTHEKYDLSGGFIEDGCIVCPNHFASFEISSGNVRSGPEGDDENINNLRMYKVILKNGRVMVDIP